MAEDGWDPNTGRHKLSAIAGTAAAVGVAACACGRPATNSLPSRELRPTPNNLLTRGWIRHKLSAIAGTAAKCQGACCATRRSATNSLPSRELRRCHRCVCCALVAATNSLPSRELRLTFGLRSAHGDLRHKLSAIAGTAAATHRMPPAANSRHKLSAIAGTAAAGAREPCFSMAACRVCERDDFSRGFARLFARNSSVEALSARACERSLGKRHITAALAMSKNLGPKGGWTRAVEDHQWQHGRP